MARYRLSMTDKREHGRVARYGCVRFMVDERGIGTDTFMAAPVGVFVGKPVTLALADHDGPGCYGVGPRIPDILAKLGDRFGNGGPTITVDPAVRDSGWIAWSGGNVAGFVDPDRYFAVSDNVPHDTVTATGKNGPICFWDSGALVALVMPTVER
jgi:hypothetical protein